MKKLKLTEKTFDVPDSWFDIKLHTYNKLAELEKMEVIQDEQGESVIDQIDYSAKFLSTLLEVDEKEITDLSQTDFLELFQKMYKLTKSDIPRADSNIIKINDKTFIFDNIAKNINYAQWVDLNNTTKDADFFDVANKVAAIFIREVKSEKEFILKGKKALGFKIKPSDYKPKEYNYDEAQINEILFSEHLSMPYYVEIAGFFLSLPASLRKTSRFSIQNLEKAS